MIAGNKVDLSDERQVPIEEGIKLAQQNRALFYETSAKNKQNVNEMF